MDRQQLADFLRSRRSRVTPDDVGLPDGRRRRTPGLRREEVAALAMMSTDYYTRLEQGRGPRPSRQILGSLAKALRLESDERTHLFHLAGETPAPHSRPRRDVPPGILQLINGLIATPAFVLDAKYDLLAWNDSLAFLWGVVKAEHNNIIRWIFTNPDLCDRLHDPFARGAVADLRAAAGRYPDDEEIRDLIAEMLAVSPDFATLWAEHEVNVQRDMRKSTVHPTMGPIDLLCQILLVPDRDQRLVIYTADPESPTQLLLCETLAKAPV